MRDGGHSGGVSQCLYSSGQVRFGELGFLGDKQG
jgi:hypothetical protein